MEVGGSFPGRISGSDRLVIAPAGIAIMDIGADVTMGLGSAGVATALAADVLAGAGGAG
jgi:hypothetical protein